VSGVVDLEVTPLAEEVPELLALRLLWSLDLFARELEANQSPLMLTMHRLIITADRLVRSKLSHQPLQPVLSRTIPQLLAPRLHAHLVALDGIPFGVSRHLK